ncbi:hypothetical protein [Paenibacillus marinisediminis]
MAFDQIRKWLIAVIVIGVLVLLYGLWNYIPRLVRSDTPDSYYMGVMIKQITLPLLGLALIALGTILMRTIESTKRELSALRSELIELRKQTEALNKNNSNSLK